MQIPSTLTTVRPQAHTATQPKASESTAREKDSFLPSFLTDSDIDLSRALKYGALGAVPGIGAVSNFCTAALTFFSGEEKTCQASFSGAVANAVGTTALVAGLAVCGLPAAIAGGGLLLASGLAAGYSAS